MIYKIANQFKKPSGLLGKLVSSLMIRGNKKPYNILTERMNILPSDKLLEIGYGPGTGLRDVVKKYQPEMVYGIDFSPLMFERASRLNKELILGGKLILLFGDFLDTMIPASAFDKIFCLNVVYFWDSLHEPFEKVRSLLKKDGTFSFFMASKDDLDKLRFTVDDVFKKYSIEEVEDTLKRVGFSNVSHEYRNGYFVEAKK